jgi:hypothetical protein
MKCLIILLFIVFLICPCKNTEELSDVCITVNIFNKEEQPSSGHVQYAYDLRSDFVNIVKLGNDPSRDYDKINNLAIKSQTF